MNKRPLAWFVATCLTLSMSMWGFVDGAAARSQSTPTSGADDAVIVVDLTGSVRGLGQDATARDIWEPVKQSISDLIDSLPQGTRLLIVPFAAGPLLNQLYPSSAANLQDPADFKGLATLQDKVDAKAAVSSYNATGSNTWIVPAVQYGLDQLTLARQQLGQARRQSLYLYTDGLDNQPRVVDWVDNASQLISLQRSQSFVWTAYIRPGQDAHPVCPPGGFNQCTSATVANPLTSVYLGENNLDFGIVTSERPTASRPIVLGVAGPAGAGPVRFGVDRTVDPDSPSVSFLAPVTVDKGASQVTVSVGPSANPGAYSGNLILDNNDVLFAQGNSIPYRLSYQVATLTPATTATSPATAPPATVPLPTPTPPEPCLTPDCKPPPLPAWLPILLVVIVGVPLVGILDHLLPRYEGPDRE